MAAATLTQDFRGDWEAFRSLCQLEGIPLLMLTEDVPPPGLSTLWTADEARQFGAVPAGLEDDHLTVALTNPRDMTLVATLEQRTGYHVFPVLARLGDITAAIVRMAERAAAVNP